MYCVARDASALKDAELKILKERSMLKAIIDNIPDPIFVVDRDHRAILTNKNFYSDYLGKENEAETLGLQPVDYFSQEEGMEVMEDNTRVMNSGVSIINRKETVYDHQGNKNVILLTKVPLIIEKEEVSGLVGIARNITAAHNLEQEQDFIYRLIDTLGKASTFKLALEKTIKLLSEFFGFEAAEAWKVGYDQNNLIRIAEYNRDVNIWSGNAVSNFKKGAGLPGMTWEKGKIQVWEKLTGDERFIRKEPVVVHQMDYGIGLPIIYKGEVLAVLTFLAKKQPDNRNRLVDLLTRVAIQISTDVRRKLTENRLNNMYKYSPNLIVVVGMDGYLKKVNPAFVKMFGYTEEELLNTPISQFLHPQDQASTFQRLNEVAEGRSPRNFQNRCKAKNGDWKWISWTPAELLEEEGIVHVFGIDITSLKSSNLELHKYRNVIESSKDAIGLFTLETGEVYLNSSFQEILGYETGNLKGQEAIENMYHGDIISREIFPTLLAGRYWEGDLQIKNSEGENLDYYFSGGPVFNSNNEVIALFGIHTDISERKKYEATLKNYGERINRILESITDGFFSLDSSGFVTHWNKAAEKFSGIARHQIENQNLWQVVPEARELLFFDKHQEALKTMEKTSYEEFHAPSKKWYEVNIYPGVEGASVYFKDITPRKLIENKIKIAKERYDLVAKATRESVYDWDVIKNELEWNGAYYEVYGYKRLLRKDNLSQWLENIHIEDRQSIEATLDLALESGDTKWESEYRLVKSNRKIAYVLERGYIIRDESGKAIRMIGSLQDITELKQNERALEELNHQLQRNAKDLADSNAELEQFAYIASHDLQEPLRMVTSFLSQLQKKYDDQLDDRARQYIHFATDGAVRMRQILLDLLDYSRAGRLEYSREEVDLNDMLTNIENLYASSIKETGATILYGKLPVICAAVTPLQRVLSNLISNGIKYSHRDIPPIIKVTVKEESTCWQFSISDNGIGIDERYFEKVFILFQRLHSREDYSGTGIGLAICKKIVENHGGEIWLESKEGKGSTFHFTINKQF
ncbi:PAS domain S-box protein [Antarcticibacterium flavum]|uniref:histidine kinase n=3 Tax=Antarcticibacterium TaxID=2058174 RepID=A0A5B7X1U0_9FLAO|nr:PAS domain S-box protein [Antarcticibacterium flavum]QCY68601.1 PAS domain S-box protein [Antarcticibacterium flavum]